MKRRFIQTVSGSALGFRRRVSDRTDLKTALKTDDYSSIFQCMWVNNCAFRWAA